MAMKKAKEIVSSNVVVVFRSVSSRLTFFLFVKALIVCMITIINQRESLYFDGFYIFLQQVVLPILCESERSFEETGS